MKPVIAFVQESHVACHGNACILTEPVFIGNASILTLMSFSGPQFEICEIFLANMCLLHVFEFLSLPH
jgi:hypothetical protein